MGKRSIKTTKAKYLEALFISTLTVQQTEVQHWINSPYCRLAFRCFEYEICRNTICICDVKLRLFFEKFTEDIKTITDKYFIIIRITTCHEHCDWEFRLSGGFRPIHLSDYF